MKGDEKYMKKVLSLLLMCLLFICSACVFEDGPEREKNDHTDDSSINQPTPNNEAICGPYLNPNRFNKYKDTYKRVKDIIENGTEADWSEDNFAVFRRFIQCYEVFQCELDDDVNNDKYGLDSEEYKNFLDSYHDVKHIFNEDFDFYDYKNIENS